MASATTATGSAATSWLPRARPPRSSSTPSSVRSPRRRRPPRRPASGSGSSTTSRRTNSRRRLDRLLDLAGLEAARADVRSRRLAAEHDADALEVRLEAPLRGHHRVAPVVTEAGLLAADCADLGHGGPRIANRA